MTDENWAIRADRLSKKFGLTLKQSMRYGLKDISRQILGQAQQNDILRDGEFWAVKNVSFDVKQGEALGIMGVNGSGKSTLLRVLNGVYAPDEGTAQLRGRVGAMIAAGAGFSPMLSGRENVYINGALLGLSTQEIDELMQDIIAFSELNDFIDLPVKNYSSGMYVRLGFAVAALSKPDVLLMDEVLAVGDLNFQKKCFDHILRLKSEGTAIILVSHAPGAIWSVCDKGLFMNDGEIAHYGSVEDVIREYDDQNSRNAIKSSEAMKNQKEERSELAGQYGHNKGGTSDAICTSLKLCTLDLEDIDHEIDFMASFIIMGNLTVKKPQKDLLLRLTIDAAHYRFIATMDSYEQGLELEEIQPGNYQFSVKIFDPNFRPGAYTVNVGILSKSVGVHLFYWFDAANFMIRNPKDTFLYADNNAVMHLNSVFDICFTGDN